MLYHGQIEEINGEQEYSHNYLIKAKTEEEAQQKLDDYAKTFYGGGCSKDDGGYSFFGGCIFIRADFLGHTTKAKYWKHLMMTHLIQ